MTADSKGIPHYVDRGFGITAPTDSAAYEKALIVGAEREKLNDQDLHDQYLHFELYNNDDVLITGVAIE